MGLRRSSQTGMTAASSSQLALRKMSASDDALHVRCSKRSSCAWRVISLSTSALARWMLPSRPAGVSTAAFHLVSCDRIAGIARIARARRTSTPPDAKDCCKARRTPRANAKCMLFTPAQGLG